MENVRDKTPSNNSSFLKNSNLNDNANPPALSNQAIENMVNHFYKVNYLVKNKIIEYVNQEYKEEVVEEKEELHHQEENLLHIFKEIDKKPIEYNPVYFINGDPLYYKHENKAENKKNKKNRKLKDISNKTGDNHKELDDTL